VSETKTERSIRLNLTGELFKDFQKLQAHFGIRNATDLVRYLIRREALRLEGKEI